MWDLSLNNIGIAVLGSLFVMFIFGCIIFIAIYISEKFLNK